jgi:phosphatidate cytidylyltransferase
MVVLVFACQAVVFSELSSLFDYGYKSSSHPSSHHHHHNGLTGGEIPETVLLAREMRDARKRAEREKWSKVMSWCVSFPLCP